MILRLLFIVAFLSPCSRAQKKEFAFREDFKEVPAHIPATSEDLTSGFLTLQRLGPGADKLKLSYHPHIPNDPHYLWNGECEGPILIGFPFEKPLDLSAKDWNCHLNTKNFGKSTLHLAVRSEGKWFAQKQSVAIAKDWNNQTLPIHPGPWFSLDPDTVTFGEHPDSPDYKSIDAIGFAAPRNPDSSNDCIRLNWFKLARDTLSEAKTSSLAENGFIEPETPFLRSALVFEHEGKEHFVRRGAIVPLHYKNRWACFDPDTLRWTVVWEAPPGKQPVTMDSMAAVSFPDKKAKAIRAPRLVGQILLTFPPNFYSPQFQEQRTQSLINRKLPVGPSPKDQGQWLGISIDGKKPVIHYSRDSGLSYETASSNAEFLFQRIVHSEKEKETSPDSSDYSVNYRPDGKIEGTRTEEFKRQEPEAVFPNVHHVENEPSSPTPNFSIRNINFPRVDRPIRATDIAFHELGDAFLTTLDGDVWRIQNSDQETSRWTRIATGLFEPMAIEIDNQNRIFVLGRDQITELLDLNNDGHIDKFRNASDIFQQTLHTRDYATSLAIEEDGSFLIAKGGIMSMGEKGIENELSKHRGTIIRISPDGKKAEVLADGLRLPYVGLRADGRVFASDQQGQHIPSTPLHLISHQNPFLGFEPTNFDKNKTVSEPLLWYPYQANRSGAAFCTTSTAAFPDLPGTFLQVSWNGRLFAIETPDAGVPFSWKLPLQLDFPALNGAIHPQSGRLYVVGLGISGYKPTTKNLIGLASIEQHHPFPTPRTLEISENTIRVTFNRPLAKTESITPGNPTLRLFNIKRTPKYGSGHYLWNNQPGEHRFSPQGFQLSPDRQTFTATFDSLHRSNLFDLTLNISTAKTTFPIHLYTRPQHLPPASRNDLEKLAAAQKQKPALQPGQADLGEPLFTQYACAGCHSLAGDKLVGPALNGIAGRLNRAKLRESILNPTAEITEGFDPAMPSFEGAIPLQDLEHLLSYLETLE